MVRFDTAAATATNPRSLQPLFPHPNSITEYFFNNIDNKQLGTVAEV